MVKSLEIEIGRMSRIYKLGFKAVNDEKLRELFIHAQHDVWNNRYLLRIVNKW